MRDNGLGSNWTSEPCDTFYCTYHRLPIYLVSAAGPEARFKAGDIVHAIGGRGTAGHEVCLPSRTSAQQGEK